MFDGDYLNLCNTDSKTCNLDTFRNIMKAKMIPEEYIEEVCQLPPPAKETELFLSSSLDASLSDGVGENSWIYFGIAFSLLEALIIYKFGKMLLRGKESKGVENISEDGSYSLLWEIKKYTRNVLFQVNAYELNTFYIFFIQINLEYYIIKSERSKSKINFSKNF